MLYIKSRELCYGCFHNISSLLYYSTVSYWHRSWYQTNKKYIRIKFKIQEISKTSFSGFIIWLSLSLRSPEIMLPYQVVLAVVILMFQLYIILAQCFNKPQLLKFLNWFYHPLISLMNLILSVHFCYNLVSTH